MCNLKLHGSCKFRDQFVGQIEIPEHIGKTACRLYLSLCANLCGVHNVFYVTLLYNGQNCKGVLGTLACGIALCSAVLGTLHHGITPWGGRHQKGYLLVPWYHYGTTTVALLKASGLVPVPWAHWIRLN